MFWKLSGRRRKEVSAASWWGALQSSTRAWGLRINGWLQHKAMALPPVRLKLYAVLFVLFFGSWNGWIMVQALRHPHRSIQVRQLPLSHLNLTPAPLPVDPSSLAGLQKFRWWLDSLRADTTGRRIYDTILQQRPGLLDSLGQIEKTYSIHH